MKKRNLLLMLGLCLVMSLTACNSESSSKDDDDDKDKQEETLEGKWEAEWDMTDMLIEEMGSEMEDYADCFKDISLVFCFEFTEDEVTLSIDEDSIDDFGENLEDSMVRLFEAALEDMAKEADMDVDDFCDAMGYTKDQYLDMFLESMDLDAMVDELVGEVEEETAEYEVDDDVIVVTYEDDEEEEWEFELDGDELTLVVDVNGEEIEFECERP